jgi:hypothetical protein
MATTGMSLNMTSPIPTLEPRIIPARFRIFVNYDRMKQEREGIEVQPGQKRPRSTRFPLGDLQEGLFISDNNLFAWSRKI